jgi:hypothetical protein
MDLQEGGAYPLQVFDLLAIFAALWLGSRLVRVLTRDDPPRAKPKAQ